MDASPIRRGQADYNCRHGILLAILEARKSEWAKRPGNLPCRMGENLAHHVQDFYAINLKRKGRRIRDDIELC
jgi:hypothetical protein